MNTPAGNATEVAPKAPPWVETMLMPRLRANGNCAQGQLYVPYAEITMVPLSYSLRLIEDERCALLEGTVNMNVPFMGEEKETFQLKVDGGNVRMVSKRTQEPGEFETRMMYILYAAANLRHLLQEGTVVD